MFLNAWYDGSFGPKLFIKKLYQARKLTPADLCSSTHVHYEIHSARASSGKPTAQGHSHFPPDHRYQTC
eukprot:3167720-Amphidinium_carterae.1